MLFCDWIQQEILSNMGKCSMYRDMRIMNQTFLMMLEDLYKFRWIILKKVPESQNHMPSWPSKICNLPMDWALQTTWSYHWTGHDSNHMISSGLVPWTTIVRQLNWRIHSAMLGLLVHSFMLLIFICVLPFILAKVPDSFIPFHVLISYDLINSFYVSVDFSCIALLKFV